MKVWLTCLVVVGTTASPGTADCTPPCCLIISAADPSSTPPSDNPSDQDSDLYLAVPAETDDSESENEYENENQFKSEHHFFKIRAVDDGFLALSISNGGISFRHSLNALRGKSGAAAAKSILRC